MSCAYARAHAGARWLGAQAREGAQLVAQVGFGLTLLALLAVSLPGCGPDDPRPCVLVVTIDTLRADAVSAWGREQGTTPVLDALAADGVRFARCTTVTPLTLPAHASLFTGLRPARHGLTVNGVSAAPFRAPPLADQLASAGWDTAAFVSAAILDRRHGLDEGFGLYDDELQRPGGPPMPHERRADHTVDTALDWLEDAEGPWFAWVHLYDPHAPYAAPDAPASDPPAAGQDPRPAYLREVAFADAQLGRLLGAARARAPGELLVVVTSDHGEGLGEHGEATHGVLIHETTMHVPLVFARLGAGPREPRGFPDAGVVRSDVVSLLDVAPTLAELLGLPAQAGLDGRSVVQPRPGRPLPLESASPRYYYGFSALAGVRQDERKLSGAPEAAAPGWQLVDLARDPAEAQPQPADPDEPLLAWIPSTTPEVDAQQLTEAAAALQALGYLGPGGAQGEQGPRRDPRGAGELLAAINAANTSLVQGDAAGAYARLAGLRTAWGDVPELRLFLGKSLRMLGRLPEAAVELSLGAQLNPASTDLRLEWAKVLLEQASASAGGPGPALEQLDLVDQLTPGHPEAIALRALAEVVFGDPAAALARLEPALRERPRATNLLAVKLRALQALGREAEARALAEQLGQTPD